MATFIDLDSYWRNRDDYPNPCEYEVSAKQTTTWMKAAREVRSKPQNACDRPNEFVTTVHIDSLSVPYPRAELFSRVVHNVSSIDAAGGITFIPTPIVSTTVITPAVVTTTIVTPNYGTPPSSTTYLVVASTQGIHVGDTVTVGVFGASTVTSIQGQNILNLGAALAGVPPSNTVVTVTPAPTTTTFINVANTQYMKVGDIITIKYGVNYESKKIVSILSLTTLTTTAFAGVAADNSDVLVTEDLTAASIVQFLDSNNNIIVNTDYSFAGLPLDVGAVFANKYSPNANTVTTITRIGGGAITTTAQTYTESNNKLRFVVMTPDTFVAGVTIPGSMTQLDAARSILKMPRLYLDFHCKKFNDLDLVYSIDGVHREAKFIATYDKTQTDEFGNPMWLHYKCPMEQVFRFSRNEPVVVRLMGRDSSVITVFSDLTVGPSLNTANDPLKNILITLCVTPYIRDNDYSHHNTDTIA